MSQEIQRDPDGAGGSSRPAPKRGPVKKSALALMVLAMSGGGTVLLIELALRIIDPYGVSYWHNMVQYGKRLQVASASNKILWEHRPNSHARLGGVRVDINSDGLRDIERPTAKAEGTFRIIAPWRLRDVRLGSPAEGHIREGTRERAQPGRPTRAA